jgi:glycosyltransferase involved in cell wall biosynthesis
MKILVLLAYYNRPKMVRLALESVKLQSHEDWEIAIVDDSSIYSIEPIAKEFFGNDERVKLFHTNDTDQQKVARGGSNLGKYWNEAVIMSSANIAIMLCDDDALYPDYLQKLNDYYEINKNVKYSYSHVSIFDPYETTNLDNVKNKFDHWLNKYTKPINPFHKVDASQVSWRTSAFKEDYIRFQYPQTKDLDSSLYKQLFKKYGPCPYNEMVSQYKGWFKGQLGQRSSQYAILE